MLRRLLDVFLAILFLTASGSFFYGIALMAQDQMALGAKYTALGWILYYVLAFILKRL